jgi:hypothetical protein
MLMFVFVIFEVVVIFRGILPVLVAVPAMSMSKHMHAHKKDDDQYEEPVFSYPFHSIHLKVIYRFSSVFS